MVELRALGTAEIHTASTLITPSQEIVFAAAVYLVLERGRRVSRPHLASLLWPGVDDQARSHRLRQTLFQLKKLGMPIDADRTSLLLRSNDAKTDFDSLSTEDFDITRQTSFEFLPGYTPRLSEGLRDWLDTKRRERHAAVTRFLVQQLERRRLQGDWIGIEEIAARCLSLDPYNENAVLAQAESAAMRGAKREAVALLDRYISEVGTSDKQLQIPASVLRRRVAERIPESRSEANWEAPFVGREKETEELTRAFQKARNREGSALLIVGEPGIGKSRLTAEIGRFAELQGAQVHYAKCRLGDVDRPLSIFVDIVPQLREMPGALGCAPETLASLKRLTEFERRTDDTAPTSDSGTLFQALREALFDLLDSVAEERCLVLLIEDVHWLDAASAKILIRMVEWCKTRRVLLLVTSRRLACPILDDADRAHLRTLNLNALTKTACSALLESVVTRLGEKLQTALVDWCLSVAEGNPFFLQELAHHWIETGHRYEAPPSVNSVLHQRLMRLSSNALQVLQTSAILGDFATSDRVERLLGYPAHQLLSAIEELSDASMLGPPSATVEGTGGRLQPRHDFLSSAATSRLAAVSLAFLHRRAADILHEEISRTAMPATLLWACADHAHQGGDRKRALSLALSCAQHLSEMGLAEAACKRYGDSIAYCSSDEDRLAVLAPLATAYQSIGEWSRCKDTLRSCMKLESNLGNTNQHSEFEFQLFQARYRSDLDFVGLLEDLLPCVKCATASPQHRVRAAVVALKVASDVGPSAMLDTIYAEIESLLGLDDVDPVARLEAEIIYKTMRTREDIDLSLLDRLATAARSLHGEMAYSFALLASSTACRIAAKDEEALRFVKLALAHAREYRLRVRVPVIRLVGVRVHVAAEDWAAARVALSGERDYPIPDDDRISRAELDFCDARVALSEGDLLRTATAIAGFESVPQSLSANRRAACLAVTLRLHLARGCDKSLILPLVQDLEAVHLVNRDLGTQDFETVALYRGLVALGDSQRANHYLTEYIYKYRMSRRPLTKEIQELLRTNGPARSRRNGLDGTPPVLASESRSTQSVAT